MKRPVYWLAPTLVGLATVLLWPALAQNTKSETAVSGKNTVSAKDRKFMMKAAIGGMAEVKLGQLATQQGTSENVKQFGQRMVDDHSKANEQLKQLAASKNVTLPTDLDAKNKAVYDRLAKLHGAAFDSAYIKDMVKDHTEDVAEFKKASAQCQDPDLKAFASSTLPTLQEHLQMARSLRSNKKSMKGMSSSKM